MIWRGAALEDACGNSIIQQVLSPEGQRKAVVFRRDCGTTTGDSTHVSILPVQEALPNDGGNVFVADTNHGAAPSGQGGGPNIMVRWLDSRRLKIVFDHRARTFNKQTRHQSASVVYAIR